jgi:hypothetical protein
LIQKRIRIVAEEKSTAGSTATLEIGQNLMLSTQMAKICGEQMGNSATVCPKKGGKDPNLNAFRIHDDLAATTVFLIK